MRRFVKTGLSIACGLLCASALWAQPLPSEQRTAARLAEQHCASCHGVNGQSATPAFPRLAGQHEAYLVKQLKDFASGARKSEAMQDKVKILDDSAIRLLASHYARQKPTHTPSEDGLLMGVGQYIYERGNLYSGVAACLSCHGTHGRGAATLPRLAGQHPSYLERQLKQFHAGQRGNDAMSGFAGRMTELEIKAVSEYLGALK